MDPNGHPTSAGQYDSTSPAQTSTCCPICRTRPGRAGTGSTCRECAFGEPQRAPNPECPHCRLEGRECRWCREQRVEAEQGAKWSGLTEFLRLRAASGHEVRVAVGYREHGTGVPGAVEGTPTGFARIEVPAIALAGRRFRVVMPWSLPAGKRSLYRWVDSGLRCVSSRHPESVYLVSASQRCARELLRMAAEMHAQVTEEAGSRLATLAGEE